MMRRTKIVCTIGPASDTEEMIAKLIAAGMNVARLNFSHGTTEYQREPVREVKRLRKALNKPVPVLRELQGTKKDRKDIVVGLEEGVDAIALSFVRKAADILACRKVIKDHGGNVPIIAKIEKHEAVDNIDSIVAASQAVMVARGDLGVEIDLERVPLVQKSIIRKCNALGRPVITATQMLQRMVDNPRPTRAEATDVANAILDGTDAVMLSEETAVGKYPSEAVMMMDRIARAAECCLDVMKFENIPIETG